MLGDERRCREVGCDDYLTKPIDREKLLSQIARHVHEQQPSVGT